MAPPMNWLCAAIGLTIVPAAKALTTRGSSPIVAQVSAIGSTGTALAEAAIALTPRQRDRLLAAAAIVLGAHPEWGVQGVRFDLVLVDDAGTVRRISDAFRLEAG